ncbi:DNA-binding heavy metal response regulator [Pseudomonas syringae pv. cilantro]|uniref:DNA-binding heavy metal response regulator n=1 Tax=Pseudomonas syringae pv. cilantro TaxID=81035 RepID=A0A0N0GDI9_PSESX|nr:DNA-binding heavy metal response regulator [Pseudomonas syringae pv. cilantro]
MLIIEDEEKTADYLRRGLNEQGYTVDVARDGIEGLHLALENEYAVIILDVMLPGLDGFGVLRALRARKQTPVIMLTAREQVDDRIRGRDETGTAPRQTFLLSGTGGPPASADPAQRRPRAGADHHCRPVD